MTKGRNILHQQVKTVRALERGLDVLAEVQNHRGCSLHKLHCELGLPKATLLRMLVTLSKHGLIWKRIADGTYHPSVITHIDHENAFTDELAEIASPFMEQLISDVNLPSVIAVPRSDYMAIIETNSPLLADDSTILGPVGTKLSYIHTATGRAYLAHCSDRERKEIIDRIRPLNASDSDEQDLMGIIADVKSRGYSLREPAHCWFDRNKQTVLRDGRWSMAVPVSMHDNPIASLNITCPSKEAMPEKTVAHTLHKLQRTANNIGQAIENSALTKVI